MCPLPGKENDHINAADVAFITDQLSVRRESQRQEESWKPFPPSPGVGGPHSVCPAFTAGRPVGLGLQAQALGCQGRERAHNYRKRIWSVGSPESCRNKVRGRNLNRFPPFVFLLWTGRAEAAGEGAGEAAPTTRSPSGGTEWQPPSGRGPGTRGVSSILRTDVLPSRRQNQRREG